jgi:hypothetical protein
MNAIEFIDLLSSLSPADRQTRVRFQPSLGAARGGGSVYVNFVNLPPGRGDGAEAENNRASFWVEGFNYDPSVPVAKVKVDQNNNVFHRAWLGAPAVPFRAKSGSPESIARYLAAYIDRVVRAIPPRFTNTAHETRKGEVQMPRKSRSKSTEPTPEEEGAQILEAAEKAGANYAEEQIGGDHFRDWVYEQVAEAHQMGQQDPDSVFPSDTPEGAKKAARNMLQQLEWDTHKQMDQREVLELSGASGIFDMGSADWVRDTYGITAKDVTDAFFSAFDEELEKPATRQWLTDIVLETNEDVVVEERGRRGGPSHIRRHVREYVPVDTRGRPLTPPTKDYEKAKREADRAGGVVKFKPENARTHRGVRSARPVRGPSTRWSRSRGSK